MKNKFLPCFLLLLWISFKLTAQDIPSSASLVTSQATAVHTQPDNGSYANIFLYYPIEKSGTPYSVFLNKKNIGKITNGGRMECKLLLEGPVAIGTDKITMINKLIQPDYQTRKETMNKAIVLWEKALAEADFDNKKARIDSKVGRHLYYNLALAYLWIDDFVKAKEYAQGRKKDLGSWDKNLLSGIRDLSSLIDDRAARQEANKSRSLLLSDSNVFVYKDPATRQREKEEALAVIATRNAFIADSTAKANKAAKVQTAKGKTKPTAPAKGGTAAKPTAKPANTKSAATLVNKAN